MNSTHIDIGLARYSDWAFTSSVVVLVLALILLAVELAYSRGRSVELRELVTAGARPRRLMFSGLESLTASERRVAQMAASGLSNRQVAEQLFVTVKTVENHLTRVYSKLDITSREQLTGALAGTE